MRIFNQYHNEFRELWAVHEFFRTLGFPSKDIYLHLSPENIVFVILLAQGKQFTVAVAKTKLNEENFNSSWINLVEKINGDFISDEELEEVWLNSEIFKNKLAALIAMKNKGIQVLNNN